MTLFHRRSCFSLQHPSSESDTHSVYWLPCLLLLFFLFQLSFFFQTGWLQWLWTGEWHPPDSSAFPFLAAWSQHKWYHATFRLYLGLNPRLHAWWENTTSWLHLQLLQFIYFLSYKLREIQKEEEEEEADPSEASMSPLPFFCVCLSTQLKRQQPLSVFTSTPSPLLLSLAGLYQQLLHWILFQAPLFLLTPKEVRQACCSRDSIMYRLGLLVVSCNTNLNCS